MYMGNIIQSLIDVGESTLIGATVGGGVGGVVKDGANNDKSITNQILLSSGGLVGGAACGAAMGVFGALYQDYKNDNNSSAA